MDAQGRPSYVTSAGSGPSTGKHLLMAYLPAEQARAGARLFVEYLGERYPVTVAVAGSTPLFDPGNERIRRARRWRSSSASSASRRSAARSW